MEEATTPLAAENLPLRPVRSLPSLVRELSSADLSRADLAGLAGSALGLLVAEWARSEGPPLVCVVEDLDAARRLAGDAGFFLGDEGTEQDAEEGRGQVLVLPVGDSSPFVDAAPDRRVAMGRLATLFHLSQGIPWRVLVVPAAGLARRVVPRAALAPRSDLVQVEELVDRDKLLLGLEQGGYLRVPVVEDPGTFAVRGAVLDLWPASSRWPVRLELDEELCVRLELFDPEGQRTLRPVREVLLHPVREALVGPEERVRAREALRELADHVNMPSHKAARLVEDVEQGRPFYGSESFLPAYYGELETLREYVPQEARVLWCAPGKALSALREELGRARADHGARVSRAEPCFAFEKLYATESEVLSQWAPARVAVAHDGVVRGEPDALEPGSALELVGPEAPVLDLGADPLEKLAAEVRSARSDKGRHDAFGPLVEHVRYWFGEGWRVVLAGRSAAQSERIAALLRGHQLEVRTHLNRPDPRALWSEAPPENDVVEVLTGELSRGFALPGHRLVLVTEEELFGARSRRAARKSKSKSDARAFVDDLSSLDVGDFVIHVDHGVGRYLGLEHRKVGTLETELLALEYAGGARLFLPVTRLNQLQKYVGGEGPPTLDRLGGSTFAKAKARVSKQVRQLADELLRLYAERRAHPGRAFPAPDTLYQEFEATFPFEETEDQSRAIEEVLSDLQSKVPMDRLVCGDVGFGKTEVALRAAFHVATHGGQVAVLCPTTVLAQQHFNTFRDRLRAWPLEVAVLSRFVTAAKQRETLKRLKEGKVDIVIGTHRLLSKDVHFKDLGLLVVDEEQRFGVAHKERIKQLRAQLDVLTLSATPIPRTLQLSVSGLRDLSVITTPPVDRRAVRTTVCRPDPQLMKEAVLRELGRGGQIFFVFNRIEGLYERAQKLQELVPQARVVVAHGQMGEGVLEQVMTDFIDGRYDVLCATAIIESGLDIPRANTMLIDRADLFGLAQLYQLRGRVGRSRERAFCYLMVPPPSQLSDEARSRLEAIERFTELGSGFHVASLDMELRGTGDLLGAEQSGNVAAVGLDLYLQMLEEAVAELRGEPPREHLEPELTFDVPAYLPEEYLHDVGVRLSLYKRLSSAEDAEEVAELGRELENRFGPPPGPARALLRVMALKPQLRMLRALGLEASRERVVLHLRNDSPLDSAKVLELCARKKSTYKLTPDLKLARRFDEGDGVANAEKMLGELENLVL